MIGNCCKLTVMLAAGNPFVDEAWHLEWGHYRYQLLDLCPSLRVVDGEELGAVKGSRPGIQLVERPKPGALSWLQPTDFHTKYYYPTESAMQWMVNWPSFCGAETGTGSQGFCACWKGAAMQPRRQMRTSASMPQLKVTHPELKRTTSMPRFGTALTREKRRDVALGGNVAPLPLEPAGSAACSSNGGCAALGLTKGDCCPTSNGQHLSCCENRRLLDSTNSSRRLAANAMQKKGVTIDDTTLRWCSSRIPETWPNLEGSSMGSLRIFQTWTTQWPEQAVSQAQRSLSLRSGLRAMSNTMGSRIFMRAGDGKQGSLAKVVDKQKLETYIQQNYIAPEQLKESLMGIIKLQDEAHQKKLAAITSKIRGKQVPTKNKKLYLFAGPPGTGKTLAMKIIAVEAGLKPFSLNLGDPTYGTLKALQDALKRIEEISSGPEAVGVGIFIDEAELLVGSRSSMQDYHNARKDIVKELLTWTEGLESGRHGGKPIMIVIPLQLETAKISGCSSLARSNHPLQIEVMATNLPAKVDAAMRDRVAETVQFAYPNYSQCKEHFRVNAPLGKGTDRPLVPHLHWLLARCSSLLRMSFRDLERVHELVPTHRDAERLAETEDVTVALRAYLSALWSVQQQRRQQQRVWEHEWRQRDTWKLISWEIQCWLTELRMRTFAVEQLRALLPRRHAAWEGLVRFVKEKRVKVLADAACVAELFSGGRLWETFQDRVAEFDPWKEVPGDGPLK
eukprot:Skav212338  [mRNA]  locus=scaffold1488:88586:105923:+ [translate_table: standard]